MFIQGVKKARTHAHGQNRFYLHFGNQAQTFLFFDPCDVYGDAYVSFPDENPSPGNCLGCGVVAFCSLSPQISYCWTPCYV